MLTLTALAMFAILAGAGETAVGRLLHRMMVDVPLHMLERIGRGHVIAAVMMLLFCGLLAWAGGGDGVRMIAFGLPDAAAWLTTFELGAYVDMIAAAIATTAALRGKRTVARIATALRGRFRRRGGRARPRASRSRPHRAPANDDDRNGFARAA